MSTAATPRPEPTVELLVMCHECRTAVAVEIREEVARCVSCALAEHRRRKIERSASTTSHAKHT